MRSLHDDLGTPAEQRRFTRYIRGLGVSQRSAAAYTDDWKALARWYVDAYRRPFELEQLTSRDAVRYREALVARYGPATVRRRLRFLLRYTKAAAVLPGLADVVATPPAPKPVGVAPAQLEAMRRRIDSAPDRDRLIVLLVLDAGIRVGEVCGLSVNDVDRDGVITIRGQNTRALVPEKRLAALLNRYKSKLGRRRGPLFAGPEGRALSHWRARRIVKQLAGVSPAQLRNSFAARFLKATGDPMSLARALGRAFVSTAVQPVRGRKGA